MSNKALRAAIFAGFAIIGVLMIFMFSDQSGDQSHTVSTAVARTVVEGFDETFNWQLSDYDVDRFAKLADGPVRKLAHIMIYTMLSVLIALGFSVIRLGRPKPLDYIIDLSMVVVVAIADEINQLFSSGRGSSLRDVVIDAFGGLLGIMFIHFIISIVSGLVSLKNRHSST